MDKSKKDLNPHLHPTFIKRSLPAHRNVCAKSTCRGVILLQDKKNNNLIYCPNCNTNYEIAKYRNRETKIEVLGANQGTRKIVMKDISLESANYPSVVADARSAEIAIGEAKAKKDLDLMLADKEDLIIYESKTILSE